MSLFINFGETCFHALCTILFSFVGESCKPTLCHNTEYSGICHYCTYKIHVHICQIISISHPSYIYMKFFFFFFFFFHFFILTFDYYSLCDVVSLIFVCVQISLGKKGQVLTAVFDKNMHVSETLTVIGEQLTMLLFMTGPFLI